MAIRHRNRTLAQHADRQNHKTRFRNSVNRVAVGRNFHTSDEILRQLQAELDQQVFGIVQQQTSNIGARRRVLDGGDVEGRIERRTVRRENAATLILLQIEVIGVAGRERERRVGDVLLGEHRERTGIE
ncbi:MAG: hypothetical protein M3Y07_10350 [Acidobacteriota bacterium]|nr:hypothetical protein [Acidobacteriota bacterium]